MIDKLSNQARIIIATVLSFLFFATYDYFFIPNTPPPQENTQEQQATSSQEAQSAPEDTTSSAPASSENSSVNASAPTSSDASSGKIIAKVKAEHYEIHIDHLGRMNKVYLNDAKFTNEAMERLQLLDSEFKPYPLEVRFSDASVNEEAFSTSYEASTDEVSVQEEGATITLTQKLSDVTLTKTLTFYPLGNYDINVKTTTPKEYFITPGFRPNIAVDGYTFHGSLIKELDETLTVIDDGDATGSERFMDAPIAASADRYYTTAFYSFDGGMDVIVDPVHESSPLLFVKGNGDLKLGGYIGPKEYKTLFKIDERLTSIIEYGFFTFISKPLFLLLSYLHSIIGNWGWAIVVMTILIRLVLFPLTYKGMVSMNKLKELTPKIKELQAKYKDDKQKLNTHMMELYKKHGANPMGGCLPILLQIPVFFAIYRVLQNAIELKAAPWILWVEDLSVMDPYFVLPIAMGLTMFVHQRITPTNFTDPMQEKIMKFLPLIFTFFFVTFPAGLTLYWFTNNLFSIAQQYYVNSLFKKQKEKKAVEKKAK